MNLNSRQLLIVECSQDYVGLWSIIHDVYTDLGENIEALEVQKQTIKLIQELLNEGFLKAGMFDENARFEFWDLSIQETITRIKLEWDALGRKPNIGEIVWFVATNKGNREAERLLNG